MRDSKFSGKKTHLRAQYIKEIRVSDRITAGQRRPSSATLHRHTPTPRKDNLMLAPINAETTTFPALLPRCPTSEIRTNLRISRITLEGREERKERGTRSACFLSMPGRKNVLKKRNAYLNSSIPRIALGRRGNPRIRSV